MMVLDLGWMELVHRLLVHYSLLTIHNFSLLINCLTHLAIQYFRPGLHCHILMVVVKIREEGELVVKGTRTDH